MAFAVLLARGWRPVEALDAIRAARPIAGVAYADDAVVWHHRLLGSPPRAVSRDRAAVRAWHRRNQSTSLRPSGASVSRPNGGSAEERRLVPGARLNSTPDPVDRQTMAFETGLFLLRTSSWLSEGTAAWTECAVDLMDQPVVRFHYVSADGYGKDSYGWYDNLWLRVDRMSDTVQLVIEIDGEWSIEERTPIDDELWEVLVDLRGGSVPDGFEERILPLLLRATGGRVSAGTLDRAVADRLDGEPFMHLHAVAEERGRRGLWDPQGASG